MPVPRIVSLIASATEIVGALGRIDDLVGRSHECDYPESVKRLPVCTAPRIDVTANSRVIDRLVREKARQSLSIYDVFDDVLGALQPTHILTQIQCDVCAVSLRDVERSIAARLLSNPRIVSLRPDTLDDIRGDIRRVAETLEIPEIGERVVAELNVRMQAIAERAGGLEPVTVACIEWLEPLMHAANWTPELIAMAGGEPETLPLCDPQVIIAAPCGFDLARTRAEMHWLADLPDWNERRAMRTGRVYLADGNQYFNRPGPRVVETLQALAEMLHPEAFEPALRGVAWEPLL